MIEVEHRTYGKVFLKKLIKARDVFDGTFHKTYDRGSLSSVQFFETKWPSKIKIKMIKFMIINYYNENLVTQYGFSFLYNLTPLQYVTYVILSMFTRDIFITDKDIL